MTETAHRELQPLRGNALEVAAYLRHAGIFFAFNHPFHFYQGQLPLERYLELLVEAAPAIETRNGAMLPAHNHLAAELARTRGKVIVGGSDAHTLRRVGTTWTAAPGATREEFLANVAAGRGRVGGVHGGTLQLAADIYGVIAQVLAQPGRPATPRADRAASDPRRQLLAGHAARGVRAADRGGPLEAARGALGRVIGEGPRAGDRCRGASAGRDRAGARTVSTSGSPRRVAITGIGIVSALGTGREANWEHMIAGLCGLRPVTIFDVSAFRSQIAGEIDTFDLQARFTPYQRRRWSRSEQFGVVAAAEAFEDSGLLDGSLDRTRVGVLLGAGTGDLVRNEEYYFQLLTEGIDRTRPTWIHHHFSNAPVDVLAQHFDLQGARSCVVAACSSSTIAIGQAADLILDGELDAAICGGTDALARLTFSGFNALRLMDPEPCKPFDKARAGMSIGEGAAMLVLEDMARARARGATIYAELAGYSLSCEAYHATAPEPEGRAVGGMIRTALASAGVNVDEVEHVNCHGTATPQNDRAEARGLHVVFGERARRIPVNSIKSMVGHCLGTAGAIEAAVLALTVKRGVIPPTIHHDTTDPECEVDVVANTAREVPVRCGVSTSLAFGGNDAALVMRAV